MKFSSEDLDVNLDYNNVTYINFTTENYWEKMISSRHRVSVSIENNSIRCDCQVYNFLRYLEGRLHQNVNETFQLVIGDSKCHGPSDFRGITITDLRSETLTCNINKQNSNVECPHKCDCHMRPENNTFTVDCSYKGLTEAPRKLDYPPNHQIDHIVLNLTGNYLETMPYLGQKVYNNVTTLALDHNKISSVTIDGLSNKLEVKIKPSKVLKNLSLSMFSSKGHLKIIWDSEKR